jgi:hypothetical protein
LALNPGCGDCAVKKVLRRIAKLDYREIETRKVCADPAFGRVGVFASAGWHRWRVATALPRARDPGRRAIDIFSLLHQ